MEKPYYPEFFENPDAPTDYEAVQNELNFLQSIQNQLYLLLKKQVKIDTEPMQFEEYDLLAEHIEQQKRFAMSKLES